MNFGADTEQIGNLVTELNNAASKMEEYITSIYSKLEGLNGNGWSGTGYDQFYAECNAYKEALEQIPGVVKDFSTFFSGTATSNATTLHSEVEAAYAEIEG